MTIATKDRRIEVDYAEETTEHLFGALVRWFREDRGWSQRELARRLAAVGWTAPEPTQSVVARIEAATRPLRLNEAPLIAHALGVPLMDLMPDHIDQYEIDDTERVHRQRAIDIEKAAEQITAAESALQAARAQLAAVQR